MKMRAKKKLLKKKGYYLTFNTNKKTILGTDIPMETIEDVKIFIQIWRDIEGFDFSYRYLNDNLILNTELASYFMNNTHLLIWASKYIRVSLENDFVSLMNIIFLFFSSKLYSLKYEICKTITVHHIKKDQYEYVLENFEI